MARRHGFGQAAKTTRLVRGPNAMLFGFLVLLAVTAYYPFAWDPPRMVQNDVSRTADGALRLGKMSAANSPGTPAWLDEARSTGQIEIDLEVRPRGAEENRPGLIMMLAKDYWHTDFAIVQDAADLEVWLRRPGANTNGGPAFVVPDVFRAHRWTTTRLSLHGQDLRIDVDAVTRLSASLPEGSLRQWGAARIALGRERHRAGPWQGEIRRAEVRTRSQAVDYVRPGALAIPERYLYLPEHVVPFPPPTRTDWVILLLHLLSFVPIGFLVVVARRPPLGPVPAILIAGGIALLLAAGKFLFHGRHTAVADVIVELAGGLLGALLARRMAGQGKAIPTGRVALALRRRRPAAHYK